VAKLTVGWIKIIKMLLGMEVGLVPGHSVLDGDPPPFPKRGAQQPRTFQPMSIVAKRSPISATAELLLHLKEIADGLRIHFLLFRMYHKSETVIMSTVLASDSRQCKGSNQESGGG